VKKRILFIDDDRAVLETLRLLLRGERERWDMVFALGPQRGLDELGGGAFDIVVSDLHMPGIDGTTLLGIVRRSYASTGRILLTSETRTLELAQALPVAQQVLTKPCTSAVLREAIERLLDAGAGDFERSDEDR